MLHLWNHRLPAYCIVIVMWITGIANAQIVITEIMHSPGGDDGLWEWIEILNTTSQAVNLHGWVLDDDDDPNLSAANITSLGGTRNTIVPAGGVAVLYPGDELDFMPDRFHDAWADDITLIGVDGFTILTATDSIGLWSSYASYLADAIPMAQASPRRNFAHAAATIDYVSGFPEAESGHSIAWNGTGNITSGANWISSESGVLGAFTSTETTIDGAQINSTNDRGNPGVLRSGTPASGLLITEIMFAPASPLTTVGFAETDFEWLEIYNNTGAPIDFSNDPHIFDDNAGNNLTAANMNDGALASGEVGILFNSLRMTAEDMRAMWGEGLNYIPVSQWPSLNNSSPGDTIAIWESYSDYNTEPVIDSGRTHENAIAAVSYNVLAGQGWPTVNNQSSIYLNNLSGDPNVGTNWRRAGSAGDTLSHQASPIFDATIDHEGGDVGSPGFAPGVIVTQTLGDYNDDGTVDAADYVMWQKLIGMTSTLPNDPYAGTTIGQQQYATWSENFGRSGAGSGGHRVVPEPARVVLLAVGLFLCSFSGARELRSVPPP
jgi:hypothetical protein